MNLSEGFEFTCPVKTISGNRSLEHLPVELDSLDARRPLVITGRELVSRPVMDDFFRAFDDSGLTMVVFDGVGDDPGWKLIDVLRRNFTEKNCDSIIALGGGVIVEVAKVLAVAVSLNVDAWQIAKDPGMPKSLKPLVIVPTAAATGMETSRFAYFQGTAFSSFQLMPALVVLDPRLTKAGSAKEIASAALAAFARSVEAYIAGSGNPFTAAYAYAAIAFVKENMIAAVKRPRNKKTALAIANAVAMSGPAMSNSGAGMASCLGRALYEMFRLPYGLGMGICLPHILDYYRKKGGYPIAELLLPLAGPEEYAATPAFQRSDRALAIIGRMFGELYRTAGDEMPRTLKEAGVPVYMLEDILEKMAPADGGTFDSEGYLAVIQSSWEGRPGA